jgi:hypothetical protein
MSEWGRDQIDAAVLEAERKRQAEKQRYDIRVEDKMAMRNLATAVLGSMLAVRGDNEEGVESILMAMRVAYRLGVDAGRKLPLR